MDLKGFCFPSAWTLGISIENSEPKSGSFRLPSVIENIKSQNRKRPVLSLFYILTIPWLFYISSK